MDDAFQRKRNHGPAPRLANELRKIRVSVFFTEGEFADICSRVPAASRPSSHIRQAVLGKIPKQIPELNKKAWVELARAAANLNQIAARLNMLHQSGLPMLEAEVAVVQVELSNFRNQLIGSTTTMADEEDDESDA